MARLASASIAPNSSARRRWLLGGLALATSGVTGCVVAPYGPYYKAEPPPGAKPRRGWCQGAAGPVTGVELDLGGGLQLTAGTDSASSPSQGVTLSVQLNLPPNVPLQLAAQPLRLVAGGDRALPVEPTVRAWRFLTITPGEWVTPQALRPGAGPQDAVQPEFANGRIGISYQADPANFAPLRLQVEGLSIDQDRGRLALSPLAMARPASPRSPRIYRTEAEQARIRDEAAACRANTPQRNCSYIVDYSDTSHLARTPEAVWRLEWNTWSLRDVEQLRGTTELSLVDPGRWRVPVDGLLARDLATGTARPLRVTGVGLRFEDRLAGGREVRPGPGETRLSLQVRLPDGAPTFDLRLAPLQLAGRTVEIPPIRFERRSFDAGIEPFNC